MAENTGNSWIQTVAAAITNALKAAADETVRENAEFAYESGLSAKIVRKMSGETCEWCREMAGTYNYGSEPSDVYRRHDNCDCTVEYVVGKDRQNVYTRQWTRSEDADKIEERKRIGIIDGKAARDERINIARAYAKTGNMTTEEYLRYKNELEYVRNYEQIYLAKDEYAAVMHALDSNLSDEDRKHAMLTKSIGDYTYTIINRGYNDYTIVGRKKIQ